MGVHMAERRDQEVPTDGFEATRCADLAQDVERSIGRELHTDLGADQEVIRLQPPLDLVLQLTRGQVTGPAISPTSGNAR